jgi:predicted CoA-substrate-specific enzyme activase
VQEEVLEKADLKKEDIAFVMATGYGRKTLKEADGEMSELSCHARGIFAMYPDTRTIIDIGGQDAKVISLGNNGQMMNFVMNDKCAAGTGRFLDVMAGILQLEVGDLEAEAEKSQTAAKISSTCTVFAESEVISQLANGALREEVVAGICNSVSARVAALAKRIGIREEVFMSGGVAQNGGVRKALERELKTSIRYSEFSQLMGAYGAALYALDKAKA